MAFAARNSSVTTYEERVARILEIISKMPNKFEAQLIRNMFFELAQRYINKSMELEKFVNPEIEKLDRRFVESIIRDLNLND